MSDHEQGRLILLLSNPASGQAVQGVLWFSIRFVGPSEDEAQQAADTADLVADSIAAAVEQMQTQLLESAKQIEIETLYATARPMGDDTLRPPG